MEKDGQEPDVTGTVDGKRFHALAADEECGSEPPRYLTDHRGREWVSGDCWCTLAVGHEGECVCGVCRDRYGAPGWTNG